MNYFILKQSGRKPIKDRGIRWEEEYHKRSKPLKDRFEKEIGPGSYYRWQGHDYTTNSDYYVVVGPSIKRGVGKMFFAGIKKLPRDWDKDPNVKVYSPYGEYFTNIASALSYASRKWGVPFPKDQMKYTRENLMNVEIPKHVKA